MKTKTSFFLLIFLSFLLQTVSAQEFLRNLPGEKLINSITSESFKYQDAVIILKEQSYKVDEETKFIKGNEYSGVTSTTTSVIIAKILNEKAILRYGSFSYSYADVAGDDWPGTVSISVRVRKPDGTVNVMGETEIQRINEGKERDEYLRKVMFKVPDLAVNDVIQIEFSHNNPLLKTVSRIFYFSDEDYVLYSNLYITLRLEDEANYYSFPEDEIGKPQIEQISDNFGAGRTYFWSAKNIRPVKKENFSLPFSDQALITVFTPKKRGIKSVETWPEISAYYFDTYTGRLSVSNSRIKMLGFEPNQEKVGQPLIDSLYKTIKTKIKLLPKPSIYPYRDLDEIFEKNEGDIADLAGLFYQILTQWKVPAKMILVRDSRAGNIELSAPTLSWFSRAAVKVEFNGKVDYYDFDPSVSAIHEFPWHLYGMQALLIDEEMGGIEQFPAQPRTADHTISEFHKIKLTDDLKANENIKVSFTGSCAQNVRTEVSNLTETDIKQFISKHDLIQSIQKPDTVIFNEIFKNRKIVWTIGGPLKNQPEQIDNSLLLRPSANVLSWFKKELFNPVRYGYIKFDTPFIYSIETQIEIPKGMTVNDLPSGATLTGPKSAKSSVTFSRTDQTISILTVLEIPVTMFPSVEYSVLTKFIDKTLEAATQEIALSIKK
ncbi:MAG: DUF3857 domain-containing protein [Bacteroidetes bacterium]|nr:DUF3857 domain-containing protein [Bacteroidota bacterium]